jgi:hypothetical protein
LGVVLSVFAQVRQGRQCRPPALSTFDAGQVAELQQHACMVVPSLVEEGFGRLSLETTAREEPAGGDEPDLKDAFHGFKL